MQKSAVNITLKIRIRVKKRDIHHKSAKKWWKTVKVEKNLEL